MLFLTLAMGPMIFANSTALAMAASGRLAGSASSLIGVIQFGMAGLASFLVGFFHDGTARPMVFTIAACALAGAFVTALWKLMAGPRPAAGTGA